MRPKIFYLLPLLSCLILMEIGCVSNTPIIAQPNNTPEGTFTGKFQFSHLHSKTGVVDTLSANLILTMELKTGFAVTGDTSTLHAGSYGSYAVNSSYTEIQFNDKTFPASGVPVKDHLNGIYNYVYDGTNLQISAYGAFDTLAYIYTMKRTGN